MGFQFEDPEAIRNAVVMYRSEKGDFADYLIGARCRSAGCDSVATFDQSLSDSSSFFEPVNSSID
ncbi:MAG: putative nucleic-acid-binding protein [Rhodothermales bacterium]|jgi:predicted nucleic-acid-binding protein